MNNKQQGFIPILITIMVSVIATSGVGYGIYKYNEISKENRIIKEEISEATNDTNIDEKNIANATNTDETSDTKTNTDDNTNYTDKQTIENINEEAEELIDSYTEEAVIALNKIKLTEYERTSDKISDSIKDAKDRFSYIEDELNPMIEDLIIYENDYELRDFFKLGIEENEEWSSYYKDTIEAFNVLNEDLSYYYENLLDLREQFSNPNIKTSKEDYDDLIKFINASEESRNKTENTISVFKDKVEKEKQETENVKNLIFDVLMLKGDILIDEIYNSI